MKRLFLVLVLLPATVWAASSVRLDSSPHDPRDVASLQAGAATYVNYCLGCHGLQYMRYKSLVDIGLNEAQIKEYLLFTGEKVGDMIKTVQDPKEAKSWFGVVPPDLSVVARSRGRLALYVPAHVLPRFQDRDRVEQRRFPERRHAACAVAFTRRARARSENAPLYGNLEGIDVCAGVRPHRARSRQLSRLRGRAGGAEPQGDRHHHADRAGRAVLSTHVLVEEEFWKDVK